MESAKGKTYTQEEAAAMAFAIAALERDNALLREALRLARAKRFGASSEKAALFGQCSLFDEAEVSADAGVAGTEVAFEAPMKKRTRPKGKKACDLSHLPKRRIDYTLGEDERTCPCCGGQMHDIGQDVRIEVEYIPATATVIEYATHKYACRTCQRDATSTPIVKASSPPPLFKGSICSPSLLSQVICDKYRYHLPPYRQEKVFSQECSLELSRQTLSNWVIAGFGDWLSPVYAAIKREVVASEVIHADEATLEVLHEPGRPAPKKSVSGK
jgi:transposase